MWRCWLSGVRRGGGVQVCGCWGLTPFIFVFLEPCIEAALSELVHYMLTGWGSPCGSEYLWSLREAAHCTSGGHLHLSRVWPDPAALSPTAAASAKGALFWVPGNSPHCLINPVITFQRLFGIIYSVFSRCFILGVSSSNLIISSTGNESGLGHFTQIIFYHSFITA